MGGSCSAGALSNTAGRQTARAGQEAGFGDSGGTQIRREGLTLGREHEIKVRVDDDELAVLDEMRNGISRAAYVRSLIRKPPEVSDVASKEEALAILSAMARDGRVTAAIALARELKGDSGGGEGGDALDRLIRGEE